MTFAVLFFLTQIAQNVLGYSPLRAGFAFLPLGVGVVITAQVTSRVVGRTGPQVPITIGALLIGGGLFCLSRISDHASYVSDMLGPLVVLSVGFGLIFFPTTLVAVSGATRHESGLADALVDDGFILLGGPLEGDRETLHIVDAESEDAIRERLAEDPWAQNGMLTPVRIERWTILLDGRR